MKLLSYAHGGHLTYGAVTEQGIIDLGAALGARFPDLKSLLGAPDALSRVRAAVDTVRERVSLNEVVFKPVIPNPAKIICVGLNYHAHRLEGNAETTDQPTLFLRLPGSQQAHGQPLVRPPESEQFDYEAEIAVIIGQGGRRIAPADAWKHVAGYSCYNDGSIRDWQRHTSQWTPGKNFAHTGAFGPWMVTSDEITPGTVMTLVARLNGQEMQRTTSDLMIHPVPKLIAYISTFVELEPGDVIATGTPGGVGLRRNPQVFMKPGDRVEIEIDLVGVLSNTIADGE